MFSMAQSGVPLVEDTLPALKVCRYHGVEGAHVYAFARMYFLRDVLHARLYCFEREPQPGSRISVFLAGAAARQAVWLVLPAKGQAMAFVRPAGILLPPEASTTGKPLETRRMAGEDEQGWFWGAQLALPADMLAAADICPAQGAQLYAGVYWQPPGGGFGVSAGAMDAGALKLQDFELCEVSAC